MSKKLYLLDTNVLLHDPQSLFSFKGAFVGIPAIVIEELDKFKREATDRGRNTRQVIRDLDALRERGSLGQGVQLDDGSVIRVIFLPDRELPHLPFQMKTEDNEIIMTAVILRNEGYNVQFISKDLNARIKADALGISTQDYLKESVSTDSFYQGWQRMTVPAVQLKKEIPDELRDLPDDVDLELNEFVLVESQHNPSNYKVFRYTGGKNFIAVQEPRLRWPLKTRNAQQLMAINLLLDPDIQLITLFGPAGTGKTFLALLAGLHKVLVEDEFEKMLVTRPIVPLGRDIGFLPGTLQEKLYTWMLPVYDNMEFIVHSAAMSEHVKDLEGGDRKKGKHHKDGGKNRKGKLQSLDELVRRNKVSLEAITYMRGRSIPYQYILVDEAQNLTPHEVKTLVTRVGQGSKIILAGDPYQIDSPYLDFSSNGLVLTSERFKGQKLFGSVYLSTTERSELSQLASDLM